MGSACIRCFEPASTTLCDSCAARLRTLLAGRPGVRRPTSRGAWQPYATLAAAAALVLVASRAGLLVGGAEPGQPRASGVWQVLADQQFISPLGMAADRDGNLYVVDAGTHRVVKLSAEGEILASFGGRGTGAGQFER